MAWSAHRTQEELEELECSESELQESAERLARWIKNAKKCVFFTGAGISTSAGIPDFRGPQGVWTLRAQGMMAQSRATVEKSIPTPAHMAIVALEQAGYVQCLISQNVDGIHRRSGFPASKLAELHGNTNLEFCKACGNEYLRDFRCRKAGNAVFEHKTDRNCRCGQPLFDTIVNFGEDLPGKALQRGFSAARSADLFIVLGSSLTVTPAADMPREVGKRETAKLVICNLQRTPLDELCSLRVHSKVDEFMKLVMDYLDIDIPEWKLHRRILVDWDQSKCLLSVTSVEQSGEPNSVLAGAEIIVGDGKSSIDSLTLDSKSFKCDLSRKAAEGKLLPLRLICRWEGHFNEPTAEIKVDVNEGRDLKLTWDGLLDFAYGRWRQKLERTK